MIFKNHIQLAKYYFEVLCIIKHLKNLKKMMMQISSINEGNLYFL